MKKNLLALLPIVLAIAALSYYYYYFSNGKTAPINNIISAEIGEIVIIKNSDATSWKVLFNNKEYLNYYLNGDTIIFAAQENGEYLIISNSKGITINRIISKEIISIKKWLPQDLSLKNKVALALRDAANNATNIDELISLTASNIKENLGDSLDLWKPFLQSLADYCKENFSDKDFNDHKVLWLSIAAQLER